MIFQIPGLVVNIRKPEISDTSTISMWLASSEYLENVGGRPDMPQKFYENQVRDMLQENANDYSNKKFFVAVDRASGNTIALAILSKIDWRNRHAEFTYIIGDENFKMSLVSGDVNIILYNFFFHNMNMHKIYGYVFAPNARAHRLNSFGGRLDGVLKKHKLAAGHATDMHVYSLTKTEFNIFVNKYADSLLKRHVSRGLIKCLVE